MKDKSIYLFFRFYERCLGVGFNSIRGGRGHKMIHQPDIWVAYDDDIKSKGNMEIGQGHHLCS